MWISIFLLSSVLAQVPEAITHTWDLATQMPNHLSIVLSMSWFGIPSSDPQGGGSDPNYGNWEWNGGSQCGLPNVNPATCNTYATSTPQRSISSRRRPLCGIYSSSGRDQESLNRIDLMLSTLKTGVDSSYGGAQIDSWAVQIDSIQFSSKYPSNPQSASADLAYRAMLAFYERADYWKMNSTVMPGQDATWYYHFGKNFGLGSCNDSSGNPKQNCLNAIQADLVDMVNISNHHMSGYKIKGKPVVLLYTDSSSQYTSPSEFVTIFNNVRNILNIDFYAIGTTESASFFAAFDGLAAWVNLGQWSSTSGSTVYDHAWNWVDAEHKGLYSGVTSYPGRVVFGGVAPGFDDYTENWGACDQRELPPSPDQRDPEVLQAEFDYFTSKKTKGIVLETWDDWTEGTEIEPDVTNGPKVLVQVRQGLTELYGETQNPSGDQSLANKWLNYGQKRNCSF